MVQIKSNIKCAPMVGHRHNMMCAFYATTFCGWIFMANNWHTTQKHDAFLSLCILYTMHSVVIIQPAALRQKQEQPSTENSEFKYSGILRHRILDFSWWKLLTLSCSLCLICHRMVVMIDFCMHSGVSSKSIIETMIIDNKSFIDAHLTFEQYQVMTMVFILLVDVRSTGIAYVYVLCIRNQR